MSATEKIFESERNNTHRPIDDDMAIARIAYERNMWG